MEEPSPVDSSYPSDWLPGAFVMALIGGVLLIAYVGLVGMGGPSYRPPPLLNAVCYLGGAFQLGAGALFAHVGNRARRIRVAHRSGISRVAGIFVPYVFAAATLALGTLALINIVFFSP